MADCRLLIVNWERRRVNQQLESGKLILLLTPQPSTFPRIPEACGLKNLVAMGLAQRRFNLPASETWTDFIGKTGQREAKLSGFGDVFF